MNELLNDRLSNYKFSSALEHLKGEDKGTKELVKFLSRNFGNCGWIIGDISILIDNALGNIGMKNED